MIPNTIRSAMLAAFAITGLAVFATIPANAAPDAPTRKKSWDNDPKGIKVFILAGQSNMVGYGKVEEGGNPAWEKGSKDIPKEIKGGIRCLREMAVNNANYPEYDYASLLVDPRKPETSAWRTRPDVKLWWRNGGSGNLGGEIRKGDLVPLTSTGKWFGPEFGFGQVVGDYYKNDDVLLIKTAWGGRALASDFRSPTMVSNRGGEVGPFYKAIFENTREVLDNLGEHFPEWKGKGYQIVGFAWHQGFNDRVSKQFAPEYKDNLPDFIQDVRAEFGKPDLPFVIASTGMGDAGPVAEPPYENYTPVEKAQLWVAGVEKPVNVLSTDTRPFWCDPKDSPSTMGHHWNHSAQSYFLIGKALGESMVALLGK